VRWPYGVAARSLIHEADVAEVAVRALTEDGHAGARHVLTGPACPDPGRAGADHRRGDLSPEPVTPTVEAISGRPPRSFRDWVHDHADAFH
jgi:uncharacterized protein YbjT (DUF2867 family)